MKKEVVPNLNRFPYNDPYHMRQIQEKKEIVERMELVKKMGIESGTRVRFVGPQFGGMQGSVVKILEYPTIKPIFIKRDDGKTFEYSPYDVEVVEELKNVTELYES